MQLLLVYYLADIDRTDLKVTVAACKARVIVDKCSDSSQTDPITRICVYLTVTMSLLYFATTCTMFVWKLRQHRRLPYEQFQMESVFYRLQVTNPILHCALCSVCSACPWHFCLCDTVAMCVCSQMVEAILPFRM